MRDVEINQRKAEAVEKDYIYHSVETEQKLDSNGQVKKNTVTEADHYWVNGVPVRRIVKKNGKPLAPEEIAQEDERIDKMVAKDRERRDKSDHEGKETDPRGNEEVTVSRLLELGSFFNARRVQLNGRDTIAVDFAGDPHAKTHDEAEQAIREMRGTAWVDERDHRLVRVEGYFANSFKVAGGLLVNVQKNTRFTATWSKINDEVWQPSYFDAQGAARLLLFFDFKGKITAVESDYHKLRTTSTILPGIMRVDPTIVQDNPAQP
jgi:hypothetical protein